MSSKGKIRKLNWGLVVLVVVGLHLLLGLVEIDWSGYLPQRAANKEPIEIETVNGKSFVKTSRPKDQLDDKDIKPRFGGTHKNRVKKETKSPRVGKFQQGSPNGTPPEPGSLGMSDLMPLRSAQSAVLPKDLAIGQETLLNTDPILYASFLNRIQDEIYGPWNRRLGEALRLLSERLGANTYITRLKVEVDRDGNIVAMNTLKSCGYREIDAAPKDAFWEIEPFQNPPVSDDEETLPFVFEFHFNLEKSLFGGVKWVL